MFKFTLFFSLYYFSLFSFPLIPHSFISSVNIIPPPPLLSLPSYLSVFSPPSSPLSLCFLPPSPFPLFLYVCFLSSSPLFIFLLLFFFLLLYFFPSSSSLSLCIYLISLHPLSLPSISLLPLFLFLSLPFFSISSLPLSASVLSPVCSVPPPSSCVLHASSSSPPLPAPPRTCCGNENLFPLMGWCGDSWSPGGRRNS